VDAILFSGVIEILEKPYELISKIISKNIQNIIFDRVPLQRIYSRDRITILKIYKEVYEAIIPCRIFDEDNFKALFTDSYSLIFEGLSKEKAISVDNSLVEKKFLFFIYTCLFIMIFALSFNNTGCAQLERIIKIGSQNVLSG